MASEPEPAATRSLWQRYKRALAGVDRFVGRNLGRLGALAARKPATVLCTSLLVSLALCAGWLRLTDLLENEVSKLWVPSSSRSKDHRDYMKQWLGESDRAVELLFKAKEGGSLLTPEATADMFRAADLMYGVTAKEDGQPVTFEDLCWETETGICRQAGYLSLWRSSSAEYAASIGGNQAALLDAINSPTDGLGSPVVAENIYSAAVRGADGRITDARLVRQIYPILRASDSDVIKEWGLALEELFEPDDSSEWDAFHAQFEHVHVYISHPNSVANAIDASIGGDIVLLVIAFNIIIFISVLVLTQYDKVSTRPMLAVLGVISVALSVFASFGFCMLCGIPFTNLTQLLPFILFGIGVDDMFVLVRAMEEVDQVHLGLDMEQRFRKCLESGGVSIMVTTLTNMAAFAIGSVTVIPALRWFCWYAAIAVLADFMLQVTFFLACFVYTERRIAASRYECLCCLKRAPEDTLANVRHSGASAGPGAAAPHLLPFAPAGARRTAEASAAAALAQRAEAGHPELEASYPPLAPPPDALRVTGAPHATTAPKAQRLAGDPTHDPAGSDADASIKAAAAHDESAPRGGRGFQKGLSVTMQRGLLSSDEGSLLHGLLVRRLVPFLLHPAVMVGVLLLFAGGIAVGGYGITRLDEGLPLSDLAPDGHYYKEFQVLTDEGYKNTAGQDASLVFRGVDPTDPAVQSRMLAAWRALVADYDYFSPELSPTTNWLTEFHAYTARVDPGAANADGTVAADGFLVRLNAFLAEQPTWKDRIMAADAAYPLSGVEVSSFAVVHRPNLGDAQDFSRKMVQQAKRAEDDLNAEYFAADQATSGYDSVVILYNPFYLYAETDVVIFREAITNLGFALLGIIIISLVMLVHPLAVLIVVIGIVTVDMLLFAEMWVLDIPLNTVSVVNLVMAVGLCVDYSVHIVHKYCQMRGTRAERVKTAIAEVGSAVLIGVISTLGGAVALAGASSNIFRIFFKLIFGTVFFGGLVGLLLVPVLLRLFGPSACLAGDREDEAATVRGPSERTSNGLGTVCVLPQSSPATAAV